MTPSIIVSLLPVTKRYSEVLAVFGVQDADLVFFLPCKSFLTNTLLAFLSISEDKDMNQHVIGMRFDPCLAEKRFGTNVPSIGWVLV